MADRHLQQCTQDATALFNDVASRSPTLRSGFFSASLEEFAEALTYRAFRRDERLLSFDEMQVASGLPFPMLLTEYIGGLMDLTGEVGRLAVKSASRGRKAKSSIELCLACVDAVYNGVQALPSLPARLGKKLGALKSTLVKIETVLYELALLSQELRSRMAEEWAEPAGVADFEAPTG